MLPRSAAEGGNSSNRIAASIASGLKCMHRCVVPRSRWPASSCTARARRALRGASRTCVATHAVPHAAACDGILSSRITQGIRSISLVPISLFQHSSSAAPPAFREQLVGARRGQGVFRSNVLLREGACRVTGVDEPRHLKARHIKPWRHASDAERLDGANGLLLSPHIDHPSTRATSPSRAASNWPSFRRFETRCSTRGALSCRGIRTGARIFPEPPTLEAGRAAGSLPHGGRSVRRHSRPSLRQRP